MPSVTRRRLLELLAAAAALAAAPAWARPSRPGPEASWPWSAAGLRSAEAIGRRLVARRPDQAVELAARAARTARRADPRDLRRRIREDFAGDRVVQVDGWVLSHTEAGLCALTVHPGRPRGA
jgi:hypothetical protein